MEKVKDATKMVIKVLKIIFGVIVAIIILFGSIYTVSETESAIVTTFGSPKLVEEKGLHFKIPIIQNVRKVDTTVRGFSIGYVENSDGSYNEVPEESIMITSDFNLLDVDFYVSYQVTDPVKYVYSSAEPDLILKNIAMSSIRSVLSAYGVDSAITTGKTGIQSSVKEAIMQNLEENDIGLTLVDAAIQDVEPPVDSVNDAFKTVETAKQGKESALNEANAYRNQKLPDAEAEADKILQDAEAKKTSRINEAQGQVAKFNAQYEEYKKYPLITKQRMFYETMDELLPNMKIIIDDSGDGVSKYMNLSDLQSAGWNGAYYQNEESTGEEAEQ